MKLTCSMRTHPSRTIVHQLAMGLALCLRWVQRWVSVGSALDFGYKPVGISKWVCVLVVFGSLLADSAINEYILR